MATWTSYSSNCLETLTRASGWTHVCREDFKMTTVFCCAKCEERVEVPDRQVRDGNWPQHIGCLSRQSGATLTAWEYSVDAGTVKYRTEAHAPATSLTDYAWDHQKYVYDSGNTKRGNIAAPEPQRAVPCTEPSAPLWAHARVVMPEIPERRKSRVAVDQTVEFIA